MTDLKIFYDFGCPFCYITLGIVEKLRKDKVDFNVEWIPLPVHPDAPLEGKDLAEIANKEKRETMLENLKKIAEPYDIIKYSNSMDRIYNTRRALLTGEYMKLIGRYEEYALLVYQAAFLHNLNIAEKEVIDQIIKEMALDPEPINKEVESNKFDKILEIVKDLSLDFKVEEVPTFLINNKRTVINVRDYENIKNSIIEG